MQLISGQKFLIISLLKATGQRNPARMKIHDPASWAPHTGKTSGQGPGLKAGKPVGLRAISYSPIPFFDFPKITVEKEST